MKTELPNAFEHALLLRITALDKIYQSRHQSGTADVDYYIGKIRGLEYALAVYRDCVDREAV